MTEAEKKKQQYALVVKSNELIRKSRFSLSLTEQRIVLYLISKIKPTDTELCEYDFNIKEFCEVCGIDYLNNLTQLKETIKSLRDKSTWVKLADGRETIVSWIEKPYLYHNTGKLKIRLDRDLMPYLIQLKGNFTEYELIAILALKSKFSLRLYELFKSYQFTGKLVVSVDELRRMLMIDKEYPKFYDFRRYVVDKAIDEITTFTDLNVSYEITKEGKKITGFIFTIEEDEDFTGEYIAAEMYLNGKIPSKGQQAKKFREYRKQLKESEREREEITDPNQFNLFELGEYET